MFKATISHTPKATAQRFLLVGGNKIGKTWLATTIPQVFILPIEEGLAGGSPDHAPAFFDQLPRTLKELDEALDLFVALNAQQPRDARYRHLVLDGMTGIELLVHTAAMGEERVSHMEGADFKKAWTAALQKWRNLQVHLDAVRRTGVHVWIIVHAAESREVDLASGDSWTRKDLQFAAPAQQIAELRTLWRGWADHVLFLDWATRVKRQKGKRAVGEFGGRVLHLRETPTHYAGSRSGALRATVPATWPDLHRVLTESATPTAEAKLRARIADVMLRLDDEDRASIEANLDAAQSVSALTAVLSRAEGLAAVTDRPDEDEDGSDGNGTPDSGAPAEVAIEPPAAPAEKAPEPEPAREQASPRAAPVVVAPPEPVIAEQLAKAATGEPKARAAAYAELIDTAPADELPIVADAIGAAGLPADLAASLRQAYVERRSGRSTPQPAVEASL